MQFPVIEITADKPRDRGIEYGIQAKTYIDICVEHYKDRFLKLGYVWEEIADYAMGYVPVIEQHMPEIMQEAYGIAEGSKRDIRDIMVINCRYEATKFPLHEPECTTAAILPQATKDGKTFAVKNWDYNAGILPHIVILKIRGAGNSIVGITEAGQLVREGFNKHGVAIINNSLQSVADHRGTGIPVTFLRRRVLESRTLAEAQKIVLHAPRCVSNNILLVDGNGDAIDYEVQPEQVDTILPTNGIVTHANHFVVHPEVDALKDRPRNRDTRLRMLLEKRHGLIDIPHIMECVKDHEYYPLSICGHPTMDDQDEYTNERMTVSSMIIDFQGRVAYICRGMPCEGEFHRYQIT